MDALELKLSLIEQLKTIDDVKLLTQIKNLINIATEKKETNVLLMNDNNVMIC